MSTTPANDDDSKPRRHIFTQVDMDSFVASDRRKEIMNFVEAMGKSCAEGAATYDPQNPLEGLTPSMASLHGSLEAMIEWVDEFPPGDARAASAIITSCLLARGENLSLEEARQRGKEAAAGSFQPSEDAAIEQVSCYLHDGFGQPIRLDYGTGHESSFLVFLLVLSKLKCFGEPPSKKTLAAITLAIFHQYLKVTRRLQTDYRLEPAGSHGVWGLDDYHCLPFYFGACQLHASSASFGGELSSPSCINFEQTLRDHGDMFLYLSCIRYIRELKSGAPFFEASSMLYDVSQTMPNWNKVSQGMIRLYQGEVLNKLQVVQHFVFSKLFPATWKSTQVQRPAPTATFRTPTGMPAPGALPPTRAPWAT
ncbi:MAG: hypothetical protein SGBAC_003766 [Bacillariaceae sp.]